MSLCLSECGKYRIELIKKETIDPALKLIKEIFCRDEYACTGTKVNENPQAAEELTELCADAILDGVSVVAIEIQTGEVVASLINKLQVSDQSDEEKSYFETFIEKRCNHPSSKALINVMVNLDERCNYFEKYNIDCYLELMFLVTAPEHRQKKLAYLLFKTSIEIAKKLKNGPVSQITLQDLGPKYSHLKSRKVTQKVPKICTVIGSAIGTQKIGKALDFKIVLRSSGSEFVYDGMNFVERVGFDPYIECMVKFLDWNKILNVDFSYEI